MQFQYCNIESAGFHHNNIPKNSSLNNYYLRDLPSESAAAVEDADVLGGGGTVVQMRDGANPEPHSSEDGVTSVAEAQKITPA